MRDGNKIRALAEFLTCYAGEVYGSHNTYNLFDQEFLILTEEEADTAVMEKFPTQVFDLSNEEIMKFCVEGVTERTIEDLRTVDGLEGLLCLIRDIDALRETALDLYGRGKYLAEDGEENEAEPYFIYRLN